MTSPSAPSAASGGGPADGIAAVSWNIHRGRGADGRVDPDRILRVLADEVCPQGSAQILGLQEADDEVPPHAGFLDIAAIEAATGLRHVHACPSLRWGPRSHGFLGAILFLPRDWTVTHADVLDLPGRCHRGAISVEVALPRRPLRILCTHLSLGQPLRIAQMRTLGQYLFRRPAMATVLLGDLNEWRPWGGLALAPRIVGARLDGPCRPTFPVRRPLLPLDRILCGAPAAVRAFEVLDGPGIRAASDHRPVRARIGV